MIHGVQCKNGVSGQCRFSAAKNVRIYWYHNSLIPQDSKSDKFEGFAIYKYTLTFQSLFTTLPLHGQTQKDPPVRSHHCPLLFTS